MNNGLTDVYDGSQKYTTGVNKAYIGSSELSSGLGQLADGSQKLTDGIIKAKDGADTLSSKLADGSNEFKVKLSPDKVDELVTIVNEPIVMENDSTNTNETYGAGLAPYFISLALWMGALILTLLIPTRDPKLNVNGVSRIEMTLGKFALLALVGICQSIALAVSVVYGLGMTVSYKFAFFLFCILISFTFISIMQFLSYAFGKVGELCGIVFLMLQLTSASGTFPVQSSPRFFQFFSPLLPMTYAVRGLRLLILGEQPQIILHQVLALAIFMGIFLIFKALATKKTASTTDIYPLIEL